eukprot:COSAG02_NODE_736_length_17865_cov_9.190420_5_plen_325_part_00
MAGKTRVLVVNSQMLMRFASDQAVDRLIIVENEGEGDITPGRITYNGPPSELPECVEARLGDGYSISPRAGADCEGKTQLLAEAGGTAFKPSEKILGDETSTTSEEQKTEVEAEASEQKSVKETPTAATTTTKEKLKDQTKPPPAKAQVSIPGAVVGYLTRMGPWIVVSSGLMIATQASGLALYAWYEHWANDTFKLGFRKNYLIAIAAVVGEQVTRLLQGMTDGTGGEKASKSIRLDMSEKLGVLGMPYLWSPDHSTAQLEDVVTKDPKQLFGRYSRLPHMLCSTAFSLCAVLYARPLITPVALACLVAYKYVKKPFGWVRSF